MRGGSQCLRQERGTGLVARRDQQFETAVLEALSDLQSDMQQVKRDLGRAILAAYQSGLKSREGHNPSPPDPNRPRRLRVIPGGLALVALLGALTLRPQGATDDDVIAEPTATVTSHAPGATVTRSATPAETVTKVAHRRTDRTPPQTVRITRTPVPARTVPRKAGTAGPLPPVQRS